MRRASEARAVSSGGGQRDCGWRAQTRWVACDCGDRVERESGGRGEVEEAADGLGKEPLVRGDGRPWAGREAAVARWSWEREGIAPGGARAAAEVGASWRETRGAGWLAAREIGWRSWRLGRQQGRDELVVERARKAADLGCGGEAFP